MIFAKIGSGLYVVWGLLHLFAAYEQFALGTGLDSGIVRGKIYQGAWDLLFFSLFAIVVALKYNWKNDALGFWLNLVVVSAADIGFIIFVLLPGHIAFFPGILGPFFWLSAAIFTTLGIRTKRAG